MADKNIILVQATDTEVAETIPSKSSTIRSQVALLALTMALAGNAQAQSGPQGVKVASGPTSTSVTEAKGGGQMVMFQGKEVSVAQVAKMIEGMSPDEKKKAIDGMGRSDRLVFKGWESNLVTKELETVNADVRVANQRKIELEAEGKTLDTELVKRYYQYIGNIENGASGEKQVLLEIRSKKITPDDLKKRIDQLLARKDLKIAGL